MRLLYVDDDGNVRGKPLRLPDELGVEGDVQPAPGWYAVTGGEYVGPFLTESEARYAVELERQRQAEIDAIKDDAPVAMADHYVEAIDLHGTGAVKREVYALPVIDPLDFWANVTGIPCPVPDCDQTVLWYEAGYVPGYRVCLAPMPGEPGAFDSRTLRHRFVARGNAAAPELVRDRCCEDDA